MSYRHTTDEILAKLREADAALERGDSLSAICQRLEISEQTYFRWRRRYGGTTRDLQKRMRQLESENQRLRHVVSEQALTIATLKESNGDRHWQL